MASGNKQVRVPKQTIVDLQTLASIRGKDETVGQVIEASVNLLLQATEVSLRKSLQENKALIEKELK